MSPHVGGETDLLQLVMERHRGMRSRADVHREPSPTRLEHVCHRHQGRDADSSRNQDIATCRWHQRKQISRLTDLDDIALKDRFMNPFRTTPAVGLALDRNPVPRPIRGISA